MKQQTQVIYSLISYTISYILLRKGPVILALAENMEVLKQMKLRSLLPYKLARPTCMPDIRPHKIGLSLAILPYIYPIQKQMPIQVPH